MQLAKNEHMKCAHVAHLYLYVMCLLLAFCMCVYTGVLAIHTVKSSPT